MSHTGQVHDGDQMAGSRIKKIMVITEGDQISNDSITYLIPFLDKNLDIEGECNLKNGTPVSYKVKDGKAINIKELRYRHFLYDIIWCGMLGCDIKQKIAEKITRLKNDGRKIKIINHEKGEDSDHNISGYQILTTKNVEDTSADHTSDEEHLVI